MKYCIKYNKPTKDISEFDEVIIKWTSLKDVLPFIQINLNKRIVIDVDIDNKEVLLTFKTLCENFNNIVVRFDKIEEENLLLALDYKIPFFFKMQANNWDTFLGMADLGVTDIYIVEDLGFDLKRVAAIAHQLDINIRVFPNVAQSQWEDSDSIKKFFIRPEDVELYSQYVDIFEFYGDKEEILYKIYEKDKQWFGRLDEIIIDFKSDLDNRYVIPRFAEKRINCKKECLKDGKCQICDRIKELSHTLKDTKLIVKIDKNKKL